MSGWSDGGDGINGGGDRSGVSGASVVFSGQLPSAANIERFNRVQKHP